MSDYRDGQEEFDSQEACKAEQDAAEAKGCALEQRNPSRSYFVVCIGKENSVIPKVESFVRLIHYLYNELGNARA